MLQPEPLIWQFWYHISERGFLVCWSLTRKSHMRSVETFVGYECSFVAIGDDRSKHVKTNHPPKKRQAQLPRSLFPCFRCHFAYVSVPRNGRHWTCLGHKFNLAWWIAIPFHGHKFNLGWWIPTTIPHVFPQFGGHFLGAPVPCPPCGATHLSRWRWCSPWSPAVASCCRPRAARPRARATAPNGTVPGQQWPVAAGTWLDTGDGEVRTDQI